MLRILVISLFVANLLLFGFRDSEPEVQTKATKTTVIQNSNVPTIHLFSEMMQDEGLLSDNRQCFSLGPFHSIDEMDDIYALLLEVSINISERKTQALVEKGYWVYMPPYGSLLEANEALLSLQALGLEDIGVIYNGEWGKAISLGYFRRQENALRRKKSLQDRNYTPMIRVQRQAEDRYWLDYEQNPGTGLIALDMQNRPNDFMQRPLPCLAQEVVKKAAEEPVEQVASVVETPVQLPVEVDEPEPEEAENLPPEKDEQQTQEADASLLDENTDVTLEQDDEPLPVEVDGLDLEQSIDSTLNQGIDPNPEEIIDDAPVVNEPVQDDEAVQEQSTESEPDIDGETTSESGEETDPKPVNDTDPDDIDQIEINAG